MYTYRQTPTLYLNDTEYSITITNIETLLPQNTTSL